MRKHIKLITLITVILLLVSIVVLTVGLVVELVPDNRVQEQYEPKQIKQVKQTVKKNHYNITEDERELLARIVTCEASICSLECQKDVCSVIFNRLESGKWRKDMNNDNKITVYDIIYYPNAFTPTINGSLDKCTVPCKSAYEAVDYVVKNGPTIPTEVRYFRTGYDFKWEGYKNYKIIDNTYFGYFTDWEQGAW